MRECHATGTVIIPYWDRAAWGPLIRKGDAWAPDVVYAVPLGRSEGWFKQQRVVGLLVLPPGGHLNDIPCAYLWAVRMDCTQ